MLTLRPVSRTTRFNAKKYQNTGALIRTRGSCQPQNACKSMLITRSVTTISMKSMASSCIRTPVISVLSRSFASSHKMYHYAIGWKSHSHINCIYRGIAFDSLVRSNIIFNRNMSSSNPTADSTVYNIHRDTRTGSSPGKRPSRYHGRYKGCVITNNAGVSTAVACPSSTVFNSAALPSFSSLMRLFYKQSHPDLLRSTASDCADINDQSMQVLNGILSTLKEDNAYPPRMVKNIPFYLLRKQTRIQPPTSTDGGGSAEVPLSKSVPCPGPTQKSPASLSKSGGSHLECVELRIRTGGGECRKQVTASMTEFFVAAGIIPPTPTGTTAITATAMVEPPIFNSSNEKQINNRRGLRGAGRNKGKRASTVAAMNDTDSPAPDLFVWDKEYFPMEQRQYFSNDN